MFSVLLLQISITQQLVMSIGSLSSKSLELHSWAAFICGISKNLTCLLTVYGVYYKTNKTDFRDTNIIRNWNVHNLSQKGIDWVVTHWYKPRLQHQLTVTSFYEKVQGQQTNANTRLATHSCDWKSYSKYWLYVIWTEYLSVWKYYKEQVSY